MCLSPDLCRGRCWRRIGIWWSVILVSFFCSWIFSILPPLYCSFLSPSNAQQPLVLLLLAALLGQGGVDPREAWSEAGAGYLCKLGFRLGDRVHARGQNEAARLRGRACRSGRGFSRGSGLGKDSTLPGLCGGAALWTLFYHCVELTFSTKRAFSWNNKNYVSVCKRMMNRACPVLTTALFSDWILVFSFTMIKR